MSFPSIWAGRTSLDDYAKEAQAIRDRTAALEAEAEVLIAVAASGEDYGDALEFARKKAELLHAAQQAGKQITSELIAEIDQLAQAYVTAGLEAEAAAEKVNRIQEQAEWGRDALERMFGSIIDGSKSAKQAVIDLLSEFARMMLMSAVKDLLGMFLGGSGGSLPGYAAGGTHQGGLRIVGERGPELEATGPARIWTADQTRTMLAGPAQAAPQQGGTSVQYVEVPYIARVDADDDGKLIARMERIADTSAAAMASNIDKALPNRVQQIQAKPWRR